MLNEMEKRALEMLVAGARCRWCASKVRDAVVRSSAKNTPERRLEDCRL